MTYRPIQRIRKYLLFASTGMIFSALSCVSNAADGVGSGLSITSGLVGPTAAPPNAMGEGFDATADQLRFGFGA